MCVLSINEKIHSLKIPTDLFFYKDYTAYKENRSRIYPIGKDNKPLYVYNMLITESEFSDRVGLTNEKIAFKIADYLEDQFGNTNIRESDYLNYDEVTTRIDTPVVYEYLVESTSYESTSYESTSYETESSTFYVTDLYSISGEYELHDIVSSDDSIEIYVGTDLVYANGKLLITHFTEHTILTGKSYTPIDVNLLIKYKYK